MAANGASCEQPQKRAGAKDKQNGKSAGECWWTCTDVNIHLWSVPEKLGLCIADDLKSYCNYRHMVWRSHKNSSWVILAYFQFLKQNTTWHEGRRAEWETCLLCCDLYHVYSVTSSAGCCNWCGCKYFGKPGWSHFSLCFRLVNKRTETER